MRTLLPDLTKLNLTGNPFEDFELLEESLDKETLKEHTDLFKDRDEITLKLLLGITTGSSYKVVLHGEAGVGKSSLLNKVLHDLRASKYFAVKYRVNEASAGDPQTFEKELLRAFGEEIPREALRSEGLLGLIKSVVQLETRSDLRRFSMLAILRSSDQVTIKEGKIEATGLSVTLGIPFANANVNDQEQKTIEVARVETLSHPVFEHLLKDGISLLKELKYKGIVIAIDEIDKLKENLEARILALVKDTFYPTGLSHILLIMKTRNGLKKIHEDIFNYEQVHALPKPEVFNFLEELYKAKAIKKEKPLSSVVSPRLLDDLYDISDGAVRVILKKLTASVIEAAIEGKSFIDPKVYERTKIADELQGYILSLRKGEPEYKILSYLLRKGETYARDEELSKVVGFERSALSNNLRRLKKREILVSKMKGRQCMYSIDPNLRDRVKSVVE